VVKLADYLKTQGVAFEYGQVSRTLNENNKSVGVQLASGEIVSCNQLVLAAGVWLAQISIQLGDYVPLETERGYNTTLTDTRVKVRSFVTFSQDQFSMTPMQMGLRIDGAVDLAGL
jgi:D-amino-acid dehydrogenase